MATASQPNDDASGIDYSHVPEDARTPDRDRAYKEIVGWRESGEWPLSAVEMAERGEYSAQHYRNTERAYLNDESETATDSDRAMHRELVVSIPPEVENPIDYVQGYLDGWRASVEKENDG